MTVGRRKGWGLRIATGAVLLFLHFPIVIIALYAFSTQSSSFSFPPTGGFTLEWFKTAADNPAIWDALWLSVKVALLAMAIALVLGSLLAAAVSRSRFFGREAISFLVILPIALPGIVTGIALRSSISLANIDFSFWTIVVGHATFCVVIVYNNVLARYRRLASSQIEASMDLGASGFQTFRYITLPHLSTALLAGGMLAFALSFDEIIVTTFTSGSEQTLPIWIFSSLVRPRQRPVTNVVALVVIAVTFIPILLAQRMTKETDATGLRPATE